MPQTGKTDSVFSQILWRAAVDAFLSDCWFLRVHFDFSKQIFVVQIKAECRQPCLFPTELDILCS